MFTTVCKLPLSPIDCSKREKVQAVQQAARANLPPPHLEAAEGAVDWGASARRQSQGVHAEQDASYWNAELIKMGN